MNFSNVFALELNSDPLFNLAFFLEFLKLENGTSNNFISCGTTVVTLEVDSFVEGGDFHIEDLVPLWLEPCWVQSFSLEASALRGDHQVRILVSKNFNAPG